MNAKANVKIEWKRDRAYIGKNHVGVLAETDGVLKIGVWCGDKNRMVWETKAAGESAYDMLIDMHRRGDLETIPAGVNTKI